MVDHFLRILRKQYAPALVLKDVAYLDVYLQRVRRHHIWIDRGRIVYVGSDWPKIDETTEIIETDKIVVPGYIDPHVHPFQLYRPETLQTFGATTGTSTFIADTYHLSMHLCADEIDTYLDRLAEQTATWKWWMRYDSQTKLRQPRFTDERLRQLMKREDVIVGGELTGWPDLLKGDTFLQKWVDETKDTLYIEGHLPGASSRTLAEMKWLGVKGDHEAMTIDDVEKRLRHGYYVTLRYASIRPDLPTILREMKERNWPITERFMMTTDGAPPLFYEKGWMDRCIQLAADVLEDPIPAYLMATLHPALAYGIDGEVGSIATGKRAHLNFVRSLEEPTPVDVLQNGEWVVRDGQLLAEPQRALQIEWPSLSLEEEDLCMKPTSYALHLKNDVLVTRIERNPSLSLRAGEHLLTIIGRDGSWRIRQVVTGFPSKLQSLISTHSLTGDTIIIQRSVAATKIGWETLQQLGGGIVLAEESGVVATLPLRVGGFSSEESVERLIEQEKQLKRQYATYGDVKGDLIFTLLFLQSTHLPFVRLTERGVVDVLKGTQYEGVERRRKYEQ